MISRTYGPEDPAEVPLEFWHTLSLFDITPIALNSSSPPGTLRYPARIGQGVNNDDDDSLWARVTPG